MRAKRVFVSGSRFVKQLPEEAIARLDKIVELGFAILVGDCTGADTLVQQHLAARGYAKVVVFHIGDRPRNQINPEWPTIQVKSRRQGDKDIEMSKRCDYALAIWDGKSPGTKANIERVGRDRTRVVKAA